MSTLDKNGNFIEILIYWVTKYIKLQLQFAKNIKKNLWRFRLSLNLKTVAHRGGIIPFIKCTKSSFSNEQLITLISFIHN